MNRSPPPPTAARGGGGHLPRRGVVPANFRLYREWKPQFTSNHRLDCPPGPYDFTVELRSDAQRFDKADAEAIIAKCKCKLETFEFHCSGSVAASLYFHQWIDALEATVYLWGTRFDGAHSFTPRLVPSRCDMNKLWERLKALFADRVRGLMEGDLVQKWQKKLGFVVDEISGIDASLKKHNRINVFEELSGKKAGLESEKGLTERRIEEFKSAMKCILNHLEGTSPVDCEDEGFEVFRFSRLYDWVRIHSLIRRECRRLQDGLPIYAFRREILQEIYNQQDLVEISEKTGSAIGPGPLPVISGPLPECNLREFLLIITKFP